MYDLDGDNNMVGRAGGSAWGGSALWIFALVLLALFFVWGRNDHRRDGVCGVEGIMPALALGEIGNKRGGISHEIWDVERDQMREFANLRQEIVQTGWAQQRENDRYFYENRAAIDRNNYDTSLGFKDQSILALGETSKVMGRIDALEKRLDQDIIRKQGEELASLRTVLGVRGLGAVPAFSACPPVDGCNPGFGYGYARA